VFKLELFSCCADVLLKLHILNFYNNDYLDLYP